MRGSTTSKRTGSPIAATCSRRLTSSGPFSVYAIPAWPSPTSEATAASAMSRSCTGYQASSGDASPTAEP
ncbi:hypothetical protein [Nocardiopsis sp. SBT366]|uniref:hypothetical protein n=1 Tax=Nocardiopsis sp. SBT366 TaxID=1580529 RepID=UPI0012E1AC26|nr:hypothetical protein [Nocardiopsis sp. SBT366]